MWRKVVSVFGAVTRPAQWDRPGQKRGRLFQHLRQAAPCGHAPGLDPAALVFGQIAALQQPVNEQAQTVLRGQTTRRGVGRIEQPQILQVGHHVADGGRRQRNAHAPGQGPRADRLPGFHVALDDRPEHVAGTGVQLFDQGRAIGVEHRFRRHSVRNGFYVETAPWNLVSTPTSVNASRHRFTTLDGKGDL